MNMYSILHSFVISVTDCWVVLLLLLLLYCIVYWSIQLQSCYSVFIINLLTYLLTYEIDLKIQKLYQYARNELSSWGLSIVSILTRRQMGSNARHYDAAYSREVTKTPSDVHACSTADQAPVPAGVTSWTTSRHEYSAAHPQQAIIDCMRSAWPRRETGRYDQRHAASARDLILRSSHLPQCHHWLSHYFCDFLSSSAVSILFHFFIHFSHSTECRLRFYPSVLEVC